LKKMNVNIGSTTYALSSLPLEKVQEEIEIKDAIAGISGLTCKILVSNDVPQQVMRQSFFHEITHGILDELGLYELNEDEGFVDAFGKQLYQFFTKNDVSKIMKFLDDSRN